MSDAASPSTPALPDLQWREICAQLRATDDISFKLLGFVPLFTVAAITGILLKVDAKLSMPVVLACFVGSLSTLGFWIWERRNIQTCSWLRERGADLERRAFGHAYVGQFARFPKSPRGFGKTEGEKVVYAATLSAWLLFPLSTLPSSATAAVALPLIVYVLGAVAIAAWAWREFVAQVKASPSSPPEA